MNFYSIFCIHSSFISLQYPLSNSTSKNFIHFQKKKYWRQWIQHTKEKYNSYTIGQRRYLSLPSNRLDLTQGRFIVRVKGELCRTSSFPTGLCSSSAHLVQCEPEEPVRRRLTRYITWVRHVCLFIASTRPKWSSASPMLCYQWSLLTRRWPRRSRGPFGIESDIDIGYLIRKECQTVQLIV